MLSPPPSAKTKGKPQRNPKYIPLEGKCPIDMLPPELLAYIFELGTRMAEEDEDKMVVEEDDGDEEYEDVEPDSETDEEDLGFINSKGKFREKNGDEDTDDEDDEDEEFVPFQVRMSHICRRWRQIALDTPSLWTRLTFQELSPEFAMSAEWIKRSKTLPLDIILDATLPDEALGYPESRGDDEPVSATMAKVVDDIKHIDQLLLPEVYRWRVFELSVSVYEHMALALEAMARAPPVPGAPMLESLRLYSHDENEDPEYEHFRPARLRKHYTLFGGNVPNLRDVLLWGVHLDWSTFVPPSEMLIDSFSTPPQITTNLTDLTLAYHTLDVRPDFKMFMHILRCAPRLRSLSLSCSGPVLPEPDEFSEPLALPTLNSLRLAFLDLPLALLLVRILYIPNLKTIELEFEGDDCSPLLYLTVQQRQPPSSPALPLSVSALTSPFVPPPDRTTHDKSTVASGATKHPCLLTPVTDAKLSGMPCTDDEGAAYAFYTACPFLLRLHLNMSFMPFAFYTTLLKDLSGNEVLKERKSRPARRGTDQSFVSDLLTATRARFAADSAAVTQSDLTYPGFTSSSTLAGASTSFTNGPRTTSIENTANTSSAANANVLSRRAALNALDSSSSSRKRAKFLTRYPVPFLQSLTISGLSGPQLKQLVQARKAMGCPLRELYVDTRDRVEVGVRLGAGTGVGMGMGGGVVFPAEWRWLERNVERVGWVEVSDDEEVDVEESEEGSGDEEGEDVWHEDGDEDEEDEDGGEDDVLTYHPLMVEYGPFTSTSSNGRDGSREEDHNTEDEWVTEPEDVDELGTGGTWSGIFPLTG